MNARLKMMETSRTADTGRIPIKTDGKIVFVPVRAIRWLESAGNYVEIVWGQQAERLVVRDTLSSFEERLDEHMFVRIHRSTIVNADRIREMRPRYTGEYELTMDNGKQLTMSRGYKTNLKRLVHAS
jgi:two-component system LytT family response regulator